MLTDLALTHLQCAKSKQFAHIVEKAVQLSCGHIICSTCINQNESSTIQCGLCDCISDGISNLPVELIDQLIDSNLKQISELLLHKMKSLDEKLKVKSDEINKKIQSHYEFFESEIDVYIESLKEKLDRFGCTLKHELKESMNKIYEQLQLHQPRIKQFQTDIENFADEIMNLTLDLKTIYSYNSKLKEFNEDGSIENFKFKINFYPVDVLLNENSIGHIVCNYVDESQLKYLSKMFENTKLDFVGLDFIPLKVFQVKNSNIAVLPASRNHLYLYDSNFKFIRKIVTKNNEYIDGSIDRFIDLDYHSRNDMFLVASSNNKLYKLNPEFELIQILVDDQKIFDFIYIHNDGKVYVSDGENKCIYTLSFETLQVLEIWSLDVIPGKLSIIDDVICVTCGVIIDDSFRGDFGVYFYNISTHEIVNQHNDVEIEAGIMNYDDKWFVTYYSSVWHIYDKNGKLMEDIPKTYVPNLDEDDCIKSFFRLSNDTFFFCISKFIGKMALSQSNNI